MKITVSCSSSFPVISKQLRCLSRLKPLFKPQNHQGYVERHKIMQLKHFKKTELRENSNTLSRSVFRLSSLRASVFCPLKGSFLLATVPKLLLMGEMLGL